MKSKRIGMVGAGNMAGALVRGLLASGSVDEDQVRASDISQERLEKLATEHGVKTHSDNRELAKWANLVVLAVKPQVMAGVLADLAEDVAPDTLVISIAAGIPIRSLEAALKPGVHVVRAMPNTPALALAAATAIAPGTNATGEDLDVAKSLFDAVGRTVVLDEAHIDAVTGLSGSGPAYVMLVIEALADGGVQAGLPRDTAQLLATQTVYGSAQLLIETGEDPGRLRDMVTSPGGTTIAGLSALESGGLRKTLIDAVRRATQRAIELGSKT